MPGFILRNDEKKLVISASQADQLIKTGNGDAALLYITLQRFNRAMTPEELTDKLHWSLLKLNAAEEALQNAGLLDKRTPKNEPAPASDEKRQYSQEEVTQLLTQNQEFSMLVSQVDQKLGRKLNAQELQILAAIYDDLELPADVIYLLVCHCIERCEKRYGEGRRPTIRQIEKEAAFWSRMGITDQTAASDYLVKYAEKQEKSHAYMQVLGLGNRHPVDSEAVYIEDWIAKGFPPETVAMAYDRTVFQTGSLKWQYLNGILKNWDSKGIHTPEEIQKAESRRTPVQTPAPGKQNSGGDKSWMGKYTKKR